MTVSNPRRAVALLAASILLGGLRDPRLAAFGETAVFALLWFERPAIGPARPWLPWLGWSLAAAIVSAQPLAALPFLARWAAVLAFASFAAAWERRDRELWLKTVVAVTVILALAALWTGAGLGFKGDMTGLIPPYYNYTAFAVAAGTAAAAAWAAHPWGPKPVYRAALGAVALLGVACLLLARARGATIGLCFAAAVWAARRWGARALIAAGSIALFGAIAFQANVLPGSWRAVLVKQGRRYQEARPEIWERAVEMAKNKPWFGEGPGDFGVAFQRRPVEVRGGSARWGMGTPYAHSEPLNVAAETGWLGLALWLFGLGTSLSVLLRRSSEEPAREAAAVAAAGMAAHLVIDNMLQIPGLALLFFSALGVAGAGRSDVRRWPSTSIIAGILLALTAWIPRALANGSPRRAAALFPAEAGPLEDLAYSAMAAGRLAEADAAWAEAQVRAPFNAVYPWRRAQIAGALGRWFEAESLAFRAASLEPGFLNARVLRAEALARLGAKKEARTELDAVLKDFHERGNRISGSGYDRAIWDLDRKEFERVAMLVGRAGR